MKAGFEACGPGGDIRLHFGALTLDKSMLSTDNFLNEKLKGCRIYR